MLVRVIEVGPDGAGWCVWDTVKLRTKGTHNGVDLVKMADLLEAGEDLEDIRYAAGYGMSELLDECGGGKENDAGRGWWDGTTATDGCVTCYCD